MAAFQGRWAQAPKQAARGLETWSLQNHRADNDFWNSWKLLGPMLAETCRDRAPGAFLFKNGLSSGRRFLRSS